MQNPYWIVLMLLLIIGVSAIFIGLHNVDNSVNIKYVNYITGETFTDNSIMLKNVNANELYDIGIFQIFIGLFISVTSSLLLGILERREVRRK